MSLEAKIEALTGAVTALGVLIERQVAIQERLAAGADAALAKMEGGSPAAAGKASRGRPKKETEAATETPKPSEEPADTASQEPAADSASESFPTFSKSWLDGAEQGSDEYKRRGKLLMGILGNFGAGKIKELDEKHHAAAIFYIKRDQSGKKINFEAEYDFAGDPAQDEPADEDFGGAFDD